jgi:GGDEF domain-containing protein
MRALTAAWTDRHSAVALALAVCIGAQLVALGEGEPLTWWVAGAVGVTAVAALAFDAWGGALVGLAAAAALVAVRRATGHWEPDVFWPAAVETLACVIAGACSGAAGRRLRTRTKSGLGSSLFDPVHGSLGLIGPEAAIGRLEEELARGRRLDRPVALVVLDVAIPDPALPAEGRSAALRAVARVVESRAAEQDVPFALTENRLGVICPETTPSVVWDMVGRILQAITTSTFAFGVERSSRDLGAVVEVAVGIAHQSPTRATARELLDDAIAAVDRETESDTDTDTDTATASDAGSSREVAS